MANNKTHTSDESFIDHVGFTIDDKEVKLVVQESADTKAEYKMSTEEFSKAYQNVHNKK